ncbi:hypothetical protein NC652_022724 [Populus alba x Populus x berolinensis]|nr:hypothetical protein NC652_022724 [Populus alba x Populus x berolinensis]
MGFFMLNSQNKLVIPGDILAFKCAFGIICSNLMVWNLIYEQLLSIRDELFDTFRKRHKGVMEVEEVQLTASSLHRMLLAFSEQTKGQKFPQHASESGNA